MAIDTQRHLCHTQVRKKTKFLIKQLAGVRAMKAIRLFGFLALMLIIACSGNKDIKDSGAEETMTEDEPIPNPVPEPSPFVLGYGDEIEINVWRNDDLSRTVKVDPNGNIYLPMAGEIRAEGISIRELRETITQRLSKYLLNPVVDINASALQSQKYYVLGEVKTPGSYQFSNQTNALGGVVEAGGFTTDADLKKVLLLSMDNGVYRARALDLDVGDVSTSTKLSIAYILRNGDILYVLPKIIASFERFMIRVNNIILPIVNTQRAIISWPNTRSVIKTGNLENEGSGAIVPP